MCFSVIVADSHNKCSCAFNLQTCANAIHLFAFIDETQVLKIKKVWGIGHAEGRMVIDTDSKGIGVKTEVRVVRWSRLAHKDGEAVRGPTKATQSTEEKLHTTTNPKGGHCKGKKISLEFIFQFDSLADYAHLWLFVSFNLLVWHWWVSPPESPRWPLKENPHEDFELYRVAENDLIDQ